MKFLKNLEKIILFISIFFLFSSLPFDAFSMEPNKNQQKLSLAIKKIQENDPEMKSIRFWNVGEEDDEALIMLFQAIENNKTLEYLEISAEAYKDRSSIKLTNNCLKNYNEDTPKTPQTLYGVWQASEETVQVIAKAIKNNTTLKEFCLKNGMIPQNHKSRSLLGAALGSNKSIERLVLHRIVGLEGRLAYLLLSNEHLKVLDVTENEDLTAIQEYFSLFIRTVQTHKSLTSLFLKGSCESCFIPYLRPLLEIKNLQVDIAEQIRSSSLCAISPLILQEFMPSSHGVLDYPFARQGSHTIPNLSVAGYEQEINKIIKSMPLLLIKEKERERNSQEEALKTQVKSSNNSNDNAEKDDKNDPYKTPQKTTEQHTLNIKGSLTAPPKMENKKEFKEKPLKINFQNISDNDMEIIEEIDEDHRRIALFRGIHYVKNLFDMKEKISQNIKATDVGQCLVSSAACKLTGKAFLVDIPGEEDVKAGKLIREILNTFKGQSEDSYNSFHEIYTNNHKRFHKLLKNPENAKIGVNQEVREIFKGYRNIFQKFTEMDYPKTWQEAVKRNPFVSFACNAKHGLKYGLGQKSFTGGNEVKLLPEYDKRGNSKNNNLGKLYIAILTPSDIEANNPTFVVDKHSKNKLTIFTHNQNNILSENEVSFFGYVPEKLIQFSQSLEVPTFTQKAKNFSALDYEQKFCITKEKYSGWRKKISESKDLKSFEGEVINHLIEKGCDIFEKKADQLIGGNRNLRVIPDVFQSFYTAPLEHSEIVRVSQWLHSINAQESTLAANPMPSVGCPTKASIDLFSLNLTRQPADLKENWPSSLTTISISFSNLSGSGNAFLSILKNHKVPLKELVLKSCQLTGNDVVEISGGIVGNNSLLTLNLDNNTVGNYAAQELAKRLRENTILKRLSLNSAKITKIDCFVELFPKGGDKKSLNKTLVELNLDFIFDQVQFNAIQKGLNRNLIRSSKVDDLDSIEEL